MYVSVEHVHRRGAHTLAWSTYVSMEHVHHCGAHTLAWQVLLVCQPRALHRGHGEAGQQSSESQS